MKLSLNVPTQLNELTLGQYQKFIKVQKDNGDGDCAYGAYNRSDPEVEHDIVDILKSS